MSISDGQKVDALNSNAAWVSKTSDDETIGKLNVNNPQPESGANVDNIQRELNANESFSGLPAASVKDVKPAWSDNTTGTPTDSLKDRAEALTTEVNTNRTGVSTNALNIAANTADIADTKTAVGIADGDTDMGVYPGAIISDNVDQVTINGELEAAIEAVPSGLVFKGNWDASTNSPALADGGVGGVEGDYYNVSVAGTTSIDGITDWGVGDWIVNVDTKWDKIDNSETVTSVNSQAGAVVLDTDDIAEGVTNEYYTNAKADARIAAASIDTLSDVDTSTASPNVDDTLTWDGSNWVPGVGGGSGQGGINYLTGDDTNFEGGTVGTWVQYNDGAAAEPVDGTGGTPSGNVTWVATNSNLLRGSWLGNFNALASNNQGEGISVDFTIDKADWNKSLYVSYDVYTAGNWVADHVLPFIYDVDAATLTPLSRSGSGARFTGRFNTNGTSLNYRLILHIASSATNSFTYAIDNVQIGPDKILDAPVVSEWSEPETIVPTNGTLPSGGDVDNGLRWRRTGDTAEIQMWYFSSTGSGGVNASTTVEFDLPSALQGLTIDAGHPTTWVGVGGVWTHNDFAGNDLLGHTTIFSGKLGATALKENGSSSPSASNLANTNITFATSTLRFSGRWVVQIEEWKNQSALISTKEMLNVKSSQSRINAFAQAFPTTVSVAVAYPTEYGGPTGSAVSYSPGVGYNATLGTWTSEPGWKINEDGLYDIGASIGISANTSNVRVLSIAKNGSEIINLDRQLGSADLNALSGYEGDVPLVKGDFITVRAFQNSGVSLGSVADSKYNTASIKKQDDLSVYGLYGETEYVESFATPSTAYPFAANVWGDLTSIDLTAGEWDIGFVAKAGTSATSSTHNQNYFIGKVAGNNTTGAVTYQNYLTGTISGSYTAPNIALPSYNVTITEDTTFYLKSVSTAVPAGYTLVGYRLFARRIK